MSCIPCKQNDLLRVQIEQFAEVLKTQAHLLGTHGLDEKDFYNSGLFRGAIERIRGQFSASMRDKREFMKVILGHLEDTGDIKEWHSAGERNRHDYTVILASGKTCVIELKGCLDGNNTNIFERPNHADEFIVWSVCSNRGADPEHNLWSGIHTRLSAECIERSQLVDGLVVWDWVCGTIGRICPKLEAEPSRAIEIAQYRLPPPCIYLFPKSIPSPRNNACPPVNELDKIEFLQALHSRFGGRYDEVHQVEIEAQYNLNELCRRTRISKAGQTLKRSEFTPIRRA